MSAGEVVGIAIALVALLVAAWGHGRLSSYDGWIRRVEEESEGRDETLDGRINHLERAVRELPATIGAQVKVQLDQFQRDLPDKVGVVVVKRLMDYAAEVEAERGFSIINETIKAAKRVAPKPTPNTEEKG